MVTDTRTQRGIAGRQLRVVYLQQRFMGLPVYDGRWSVGFVGRTTQVTGKWIPVRSVGSIVPDQTAEAAVRWALHDVFGARAAALERICEFGSPERFEAFRRDGLSFASAHLCVFAVGRTAHLAWVVDLAVTLGSRFEVVLNAHTLQLLLRRETSQAASASLTLRPGAGTASHFFEPIWNSSGAVTVRFRGEPWAPPEAESGIVRGTEVRDIHSINAFTLANLALDALRRFMPVPLATVRVFTTSVSEDSEAAKADSRGVVLKGVSGTPARFAVFDPAVVLHEVSHLVMSTIVGGGTHFHPFAGASAAVSEGLADFLGLTLWNNIGRSLVPVQTQEDVFGSFLLGDPRDYTAYVEGAGPRKGPTELEAHAEGGFLCGALLQARASLLESSDQDSDDDMVDEAFWEALGRGLPLLPHSTGLPRFCCVRRVLLDHASEPVREAVAVAFRDVGIDAPCAHIS